MWWFTLLHDPCNPAAALITDTHSWGIKPVIQDPGRLRITWIIWLTCPPRWVRDQTDARVHLQCVMHFAYRSGSCCTERFLSVTFMRSFMSRFGSVTFAKKRALAKLYQRLLNLCQNGDWLSHSSFLPETDWSCARFARKCGGRPAHRRGHQASSCSRNGPVVLSTSSSWPCTCDSQFAWERAMNFVLHRWFVFRKTVLLEYILQNSIFFVTLREKKSLENFQVTWFVDDYPSPRTRVHLLVPTRTEALSFLQFVPTWATHHLKSMRSCHYSPTLSYLSTTCLITHFSVTIDNVQPTCKKALSAWKSGK